MVEQQRSVLQNGRSIAVPIVRTKLHRPALLPNTLRRPNLVRRLNDALRRRLVLLATPAGYGKTTLLADWLATIANTPDEGPEVIWLTLDDADNDPRRFLSYLFAALEPLDPPLRQMTLPERITPLVVETLIAELLNDLAERSRDLVIVLDDFHQISEHDIHRTLTFAVDHLPPRVHLVLATRADPQLPLARLRARGHLGELRTNELRFSAEETASFLLEVMELPLERDSLATLAERTEGWPAGVHLAAIALQDRPDQAAFVEQLVGSHRYIVDYLLEDVFARQPAHIQAFLLQTSILRRLCGPLCDAVIGVNNDNPNAEKASAKAGGGRSYSRLILDTLEHDNLFLVPLDSERTWYRYHNLFAEVLYERLAAGTEPEQLALLHRRAGVWYAAHGLLIDAVGHAIQAGAVQDVIALIEPIGLAMASRVGEATLRTWLPIIPNEVLHERPRLALLRAWLALSDYDFSEAERWLLVAERALAEAAAGHATSMGDVTNLRGEIGAVRARLATHAGDARAVIAYAEQAFTWLQPDNMALRTRVAKDLGYAWMVEGNLDRAERAFADAVVGGFGAGYPYVAFLATSDYANVRMYRGALRDAIDRCRKTIADAAGLAEPVGPGFGLPYLTLADASAERRELARALPALAEATTRITSGGTSSYVCLLIVSARVAWANTDRAAALRYVRQARFIAQQRNLPWAAVLSDAFEGQLLLAGGDSTTATILIERSRSIPVPPEFRYFPPAVLFAADHYIPAALQLTLARALESGQSDALHVVLHELAAAIAAADHRNAQRLRIKLRLMRAQALLACGDPKKATAELADSVSLGAPEQYCSVFYEAGEWFTGALEHLLNSQLLDGEATTHARNLLAVLHGDDTNESVPLEVHEPTLSPSPASGALPEPLSNREIDVLRLMAEGYSNTDIAANLVIAVSTVKSHVNNIFSKLGVASRTQAIARARRLELI